MHNAPSVMFPVGRCALYGRVLVFLAVIGGGALVGWWRFDASPVWPGVLGGVLWLMWAAFALHSWRRAPIGELGWCASERRGLSASPQGWHWHSAACPDVTPLRRVELVMDLQGHALLCLHNADARTRWIWVERVRDPLRWSDLRRALLSTRA